MCKRKSIIFAIILTFFLVRRYLCIFFYSNRMCLFDESKQKMEKNISLRNKNENSISGGNSYDWNKFTFSNAYVKLRAFKWTLCRGKLCGWECVWWIWIRCFHFDKTCPKCACVCVCERRSVHIAWQPKWDNSINTQFADIIFAILIKFNEQFLLYDWAATIPSFHSYT